MTVRRLILALVVLVAVAGAVFWFLTAPRGLEPESVANLAPGDAARGERIFWAGGCIACHGRPGAKGDARLELSGGLELKTPFGVFVPPNISPDKADGIGAWTLADFANALKRGVSPEGRHYYPAFPYPSYARMKLADIADLFAFMKTLPAVSGRAPPDRVAFPFSVRRGIGLWKLLYLSDKPVVSLPADAPQKAKDGQYLVEGPGHCGECHTPRDFLGGTKDDLWLSGAVAVEGKGHVPNITSGEGGIGDWSEKDIAYFLESGFTPDFDSVGGSMVDVQEDIAHLTAADREAIAAYLKAVPPHPNGYPTEKK
jgi:mono/diheme cytochrome c family protein